MNEKYPPFSNLEHGELGGDKTTNPHDENNLDSIARMTQEQWTELMTENGREIDRIKEQTREDQIRWEQQEAAKWGRRTEALSALVVSGDIVADTLAFWKAIDLDIAKVDPVYSKAWKTNDAQTLLSYFQYLKKTSGQTPTSNPWTGEFFAVYDKVVKAIIEAAEHHDFERRW